MNSSIEMRHPVRAARAALGNASRILAVSILLCCVAPAFAAEPEDTLLKFPGEAPTHRVVYQLNKADPEYQTHILFSVGAMLRKYGDDIRIVVVAIGPGIHTLAKNPKRPVSDDIKSRIRSLSEYGVEFHACGNTMKTQKWTDADMLPFAKVVEVGASDLMELQEQGYAYISW